MNIYNKYTSIYKNNTQYRKTLHITMERRNSAVFSMIRKVSAVVAAPASGSSQNLLGDVMFRHDDREFVRDDR